MNPQPPGLSQLQQQLNQALSQSSPENTRRAYHGALSAFRRWAEANGVPAAPAQPEHIAAYLYHLSQQGKSPSTLRTARAAIAHDHDRPGLDPAANPARAPIVAQTMKTVRRAPHAPARQSKPLMPEDLELIIKTAPQPRQWRRRGQTVQESPATAGRRARTDIALCLTMRDAGLRRSEAAALLWSDVRLPPDGAARITIRRSKTNRQGPPETVAITPAAAQALAAIRPQRPRPAERVFKLDPRQISRRIAQAAQHAGLGDGYSGHSGRVGLARIMSRNGAPANATMQHGRWRSVQTLAGYTRAEEADAALRWIT